MPYFWLLYKLPKGRGLNILYRIEAQSISFDWLPKHFPTYCINIVQEKLPEHTNIFFGQNPEEKLVSSEQICKGNVILTLRVFNLHNTLNVVWLGYNYYISFFICSHWWAEVFFLSIFKLLLLSKIHNWPFLKLEFTKRLFINSRSQTTKFAS